MSVAEPLNFQRFRYRLIFGPHGALGAKNLDLTVAQRFLQRRSQCIVTAQLGGLAFGGQDWGGVALDWPGGFDTKGNFYVECADEAPCSSPSLYEWPAGGSSWMKLNFNKSIGFPGAVQSMGKQIGVADQAASGFDMGIYLTSVSGSTATSKKSIILQGESSGQYVDDPSSWGSINKKPNGVFAKSVKNIAAPAANAINIYKKTGGRPIFQIVLGGGAGVTFTRP
ncbi:MAG TPA: hypothetical protein VGG70_11130 [Candidatus Cybelea sp.]